MCVLNFGAIAIVSVESIVCAVAPQLWAFACRCCCGLFFVLFALFVYIYIFGTKLDCNQALSINRYIHLATESNGTNRIKRRQRKKSSQKDSRPMCRHQSGYSSKRCVSICWLYANNESESERAAFAVWISSFYFIFFSVISTWETKLLTQSKSMKSGHSFIRYLASFTLKIACVCLFVCVFVSIATYWKELQKRIGKMRIIA